MAAPPGTAEARTGEIAEAIARRTGFGLVVARGFGREPDTLPEMRELYARHVYEVAQGPLDFYVEVHGHAPSGTASGIEIVTLGVDRELAQRLRILAEMIRDAHLLARPDARRLEITVEPAHEGVQTATGAGAHDVLTASRQALHIQLPHAARLDFAEVYTAILADFVTEALSLPRGR